MSSENSTIVENFDFVKRLVEACGSDQPACIARLLDISYQAAKNYLHGRLPEANVLITISLQTPYSIHWLLTGCGEKLVLSPIEKDTPVLTDQITTFIKEECRKNVEELLNHSKANAQEKVIALKSEEIKDETATKNADASSKKRK